MRNIVSLITDWGSSLKHNLTVALLPLHPFPLKLIITWRASQSLRRSFQSVKNLHQTGDQIGGSWLMSWCTEQSRIPVFVTNAGSALFQSAHDDVYPLLFCIFIWYSWSVQAHADLTCVSMVINYWEDFSVRQLKSNSINNEQVCVLL